MDTGGEQAGRAHSCEAPRLHGQGSPSRWQMLASSYSQTHQGQDVGKDPSRGLARRILDRSEEALFLAERLAKYGKGLPREAEYRELLAGQD